MQRRTEIREIPSSLDLRPLSERYGRQQQRPQPSQKYSHILSIVDCGKKQSMLLESKVDSKPTMIDAKIIENFNSILDELNSKIEKKVKDNLMMYDFFIDINMRLIIFFNEIVFKIEKKQKKKLIKLLIKSQILRPFVLSMLRYAIYVIDFL